MFKMSLRAAACAIALFSATSAGAVTSTFDTDNEGWRVGSMDSVANIVAGAAVWTAPGMLITSDVAGEVAFFAPTAYLGDHSSAYGSTFSFDIADTLNDNTFYTALVLYGAGHAIGVGHLPPSTNLNALSHFSFNLTETDFRYYSGGGIQGATPVDQATFMAVLSNLTAVAVHADWHSGADTTAIDNVSFGPAQAAVPEPAAWALMIGGFGMAGAALRRRRSQATA